MSKEKTVKDLTVNELLEDLIYYTTLVQVKIPSFLDKDLAIIWKYINELKARSEAFEGGDCPNYDSCQESFLENYTPNHDEGRD